MGNSSSSISPLRQRMIDDMTTRRLTSKTQSSYIRHVKELNDYLGRSHHTTTVSAGVKARIYAAELVREN